MAAHTPPAHDDLAGYLSAAVERSRLSANKISTRTATLGCYVSNETIRQWMKGRLPKDPYQAAAVERALGLDNGALARRAGLKVIPPEEALGPEDVPLHVSRALLPEPEYRAQVEERLTDLEATVRRLVALAPDPADGDGQSTITAIRSDLQEIFDDTALDDLEAADTSGTPGSGTGRFGPTDPAQQAEDFPDDPSPDE